MTVPPSLSEDTPRREGLCNELLEASLTFGKPVKGEAATVGRAKLRGALAGRPVSTSLGQLSD